MLLSKVYVPKGGEGVSKDPLRIQEGVTSPSATAMTDGFLSLFLLLVTGPADWLGDLPFKICLFQAS